MSVPYSKRKEYFKKYREEHREKMSEYVKNYQKRKKSEIIKSMIEEKENDKR